MSPHGATFQDTMDRKVIKYVKKCPKKNITIEAAKERLFSEANTYSKMSLFFGI